MTKYLRLFLGVLLISLTNLACAQTVTLETAWQSDTTLRTPESVLFDPAQKLLYVSCVNGNAVLTNHNSFIAKVGLDGKVVKLKFADGLNATKGMGILNDKLYVTEMTQVAEISLATGKILNRFPVQGATFLNDIAIDRQRQLLYITDSVDGKLWVVDRGKVSLLVEGIPLKRTNGLRFKDNTLLIGNGDGTLFGLDLVSKKLEVIAKVESSIDGIVTLENKELLISEVEGKIWHVDAGGRTKLIIDTTKEKASAADMDFNPGSKMLFVPTLFHNTVNAYWVR